MTYAQSCYENGTYPTRYQAEKARRYGEVVVKVDGGSWHGVQMYAYKLMDAQDYRIWRAAK